MWLWGKKKSGHTTSLPFTRQHHFLLMTVHFVDPTANAVSYLKYKQRASQPEGSAFSPGTPGGTTIDSRTSLIDWLS